MARGIQLITTVPDSQHTHAIRQEALWYPSQLIQRMGKAAPHVIHAIGTLDLLRENKTAFFCSSRAPGHTILRAHDIARRFRDDGTTVISGFHSLIERECMRILLRGNQPIIMCPARAIETMRIPTECRSAFLTGRLLLVSPFANQPRRATRESALRRNEFVAALADVAFFAHVAEGSELEKLAGKMGTWGVPVKMLT